MGVSALAGSELFAIAITSAAGYLRCHDGAADDSGDASTLVIRSLQLHPPPTIRATDARGGSACCSATMHHLVAPLLRLDAACDAIEVNRTRQQSSVRISPSEPPHSILISTRSYGGYRSCHCVVVPAVKDRTTNARILPNFSSLLSPRQSPETRAESRAISCAARGSAIVRVSDSRSLADRVTTLSQPRFAALRGRRRFYNVHAATLHTWDSARPFHARPSVYIIDQLTAARVSSEYRRALLIHLLGVPCTLTHLSARGSHPRKYH